MAKRKTDSQLQDLPRCAAEFIKLVIKKMRYRKSVRREVTAELAGHFEDELKECANNEEKQQKAEKLIAEFGDAKLLGILLRRAKKRCRPLWRTVIARTFQAVGLIIVSFIFYCVYITFGSPNISTNYVEQMNLLTRPVADESLMEIIIEALKLLGVKHAMVVHSDGLDEISTAGVTKIIELKEGKLSSKELNPKDLGIEAADLGQLKITDAKTSASVIRGILGGEENGPRKDIVILNAAAAIIVGGLADDFESAIKVARASVSDGKAISTLDKLIEISNS